MVRALLDGSKTQTRRVANLTDAAHVKEPRGHRRWHPADPEARLACPYGQPGDKLWVRETWAPNQIEPVDDRPPVDFLYAATDSAKYAVCRWKPSIHMPRAASRITLEVTRVHLERLNACSEVDAIAEGAQWAACGSPQEGSHKAGYAQLWESINGPGSWGKNPLVWVVEFTRHNAELNGARWASDLCAELGAGD